MKRSIPKVLIILVVAALALTACLPSPTAPTAQPTRAPVQPVNTVVAPAAQPTPQPTLGPAACTAGASAIPAPTTEQVAAVAKIPPVSDTTDLVRGPATASVTILEYSDYQ